MSAYTAQRYIAGKLEDSPDAEPWPSPWKRGSIAVDIEGASVQGQATKILPNLAPGAAYTVPFGDEKPRALAVRLSSAIRVLKRSGRGAYTVKTVADGVLVTRIK